MPLAIASSVAAGHLWRGSLCQLIEDHRQNFTRFFLLRPPKFKQPGNSRRGQDVGRVHNAQHAWLVVSGVECAGAARHIFDQDRIPADAWAPVGVPFLSGFYWAY